MPFLSGSTALPAVGVEPYLGPVVGANWHAEQGLDQVLSPSTLEDEGILEGGDDQSVHLVRGGLFELSTLAGFTLGETAFNDKFYVHWLVSGDTSYHDWLPMLAPMMGANLWPPAQPPVINVLTQLMRDGVAGDPEQFVGYYEARNLVALPGGIRLRPVFATAGSFMQSADASFSLRPLLLTN